ncbi:hypothetical protein CkaCkLH20_10175 [Colletotrichum karsti]|uniref:Uncharacterized protein n=1 Tax=Colletotrichum karsti TaxID=1095194 RepID=A0A9P6HVT2_9PEZI|nr:uncharacterized protein CkaCkLH20_10175 [Colletotrichum karsti]KAF9872348.1 hypothetical protein CkaCkLH20_10175 [Colletotrichum karsti]
MTGQDHAHVDSDNIRRSDCNRCSDMDHLVKLLLSLDELIEARISCPLTIETAIRLTTEAEKELQSILEYSNERSDTYPTLLREFKQCLRDENKYWNLIASFRKALRAHYSCQYKDQPLRDVKRAFHVLYRYDDRFKRRNVDHQVQHTWDDLVEQMDKEDIETSEAPARFWAEEHKVLKSLPATPYTDIVNRIGELCCERGDGREWDACLVIIREWLTTKGGEVSSVDSMRNSVECMMRWTENDIIQLESRFNSPGEEDERNLWTDFIYRKRQLLGRQFEDQIRAAADGDAEDTLIL